MALYKSVYYYYYYYLKNTLCNIKSTKIKLEWTLLLLFLIIISIIRLPCANKYFLVFIYLNAPLSDRRYTAAEFWRRRVCVGHTSRPCTIAWADPDTVLEDRPIPICARGTVYKMQCILALPGECDWTVYARRQCRLMSDYFDHLPVVKVDRRIRWHYTTTIRRLRTGARLTRYRNCKFHNFARTISRHADGISRYSVPPSAGPLLPLPLAIVVVIVIITFI